MNAPLSIPISHQEVVRVELDDVSVTLGGVKALQDVTLDLAAKNVGIVGLNGSGKSTLARLICGLICPDKGRVRVNHGDMFADRALALKTVGIIFQNPDHQIIFPTVGEEVAFGLRQQGHTQDEADRKAKKALAQFGRSDWFERPITALSQGQRHLICLISVLAMAPDLIVLDEPFAGLDIRTKTALSRILITAGPSLVHITHDPADVAAYDHIVWLDDGRIAAEGPAQLTLARYLKEINGEGRPDAFDDITR